MVKRMYMNYKKLGSLMILSAVIFSCSVKFGMFWDSVLFVSEMGNALFEKGLFNWHAIPVRSDPGHPPFLATLVAVGWSLFGKSLFVTHLIMLPFIFGLLWQILSFVSYFVKETKYRVWAYIFVMSDATLLSQLVLVNFEIIQLFFFFVALNAILKDNRIYKVIALAFLGIVSFRGMMLCAGVFFIDLTMHRLYRKNNLFSFFTKQVFVDYLLAATPALMYLLWRLVVKGWIIANPLEVWGDAWHFISVQDFIKNFLRNIIVLGHQLTDFGRLLPILFVLITLIIKRKTIEWKQITPIITITVFSTIVIVVFSLLINNTMAHRYYIPIYLMTALLAFLLIHEYKNRKILYIGLLSCILLGNFIVYSDKFAQGWDASLAHVPYWKLRQDAIKYLDHNQISISEVATFFPNCTAIDNVDVNGDMRSFCGFTGEEKIVFYSNVYNLSDEELDMLQENYIVIKSYKKRNVRIEIMKKYE